MSQWADIATVVAAVIAVIALVASMYFSRQSLDHSKKALNQAADHAWQFSGAQFALAYREHVIRLYAAGLSVGQISELLDLERADSESEQGGGALEEFEWGNGEVERIVALLPDTLRARGF